MAFLKKSYKFESFAREKVDVLRRNGKFQCFCSGDAKLNTTKPNTSQTNLATRS